MKYDSVQKFNSVENYILQMRPILRKRALFSDGTSDYRIPPEPKAGEHVKFRFRTAADNVDLVGALSRGRADRDADRRTGKVILIIMKLRFRLEMSLISIILKLFPVCFAVVMTGRCCTGIPPAV